MSLIDNERTKLLANALDRASTACITVGVLGPLAAGLYGVGGTGPVNRVMMVAISSVLWLTAAVALHLMAYRVLGRMKP